MASFSSTHQHVFQRLATSRQWERALEQAREWVAAEPDNPYACRAAAQALINLQMSPQEAQALLRTTLRHNPEDDFALRLASIAYSRLGQRKEAREAIEEAIALAPADPRHYEHSAWLWFVAKDLDKARAMAEKAQELAPHSASAINLLALTQPHNQAGDEKQAALLQQALAIDPDDPALHTNLGLYYLNRTRDHAAAEAAFRGALAIQPTHRDAKNGLFLALRRSDRFYRILSFPRETVRRLRTQPKFIRYSVVGLYYVAVALAIAGPLAGMAALFFLFFFLVWWPLLKTYEYLTVVDIKRKAGEIGAAKGGLFGHRRWSLRARLGICAVVMLVFWSIVAFLLTQSAADKPWAILILVAALLILVVGRFALIARARLQPRWRRMANGRRSKENLPWTKKP